MNIVLGWLIKSLLSQLEEILIENEPEIITELESLVKKLQDYISSKSPAAASIVDKVFDGVDYEIEKEVPVAVEKIGNEIKYM